MSSISSQTWNFLPFFGLSSQDMKYVYLCFYYSKNLVLSVFPWGNSVFIIFSLFSLLVFLVMLSKEKIGYWEKGSIYNNPSKDYSKVEA